MIQIEIVVTIIIKGITIMVIMMRPLPLSLVGWCASCNDNDNDDDNIIF